MRIIALSFLFLALTACAVTQEGSEQVTFTSVGFSDLEGWKNDEAANALTAFKLSCAALTKNPKRAESWQQVCADAENIAINDNSAREFFENEFTPYQVAGPKGYEGLFTGYYMPELRGSLKRTSDFQTPLYARPKDMISADLGAFKKDLKGQHIVGKIDGNSFIPYDDRAAIAKNMLKHRAKPLVWVNDPVGAFFLEIQGSGLIRLTNGHTMPVGYDGTNGRAYVAIGQVLADRGDIPRPVTMPKIRAWLSKHPVQMQGILDANPSFIFFRRLPNTDAIGAEGVALTPERSLAVDPASVNLGMPVWLDTTDAEGNPFQRLMVAQDTGGAIKGAVRGDVYWGTGDQAAAQAGAMQSHGRYFILLPKNTSAPDEQR